MDSFEKQERKQEARRRLRAQRRRAGDLRGRVVAISLIGFALLWGVVFAQMATGNDPVLGEKSAAVATTSGTKRHSAKAQELPIEAAETDTEEPTDSGQAANEAAEAAEAIESEMAEAELAEIEAAEAEAVEVEAAEIEPAPVTTSQS